MSQRDDAQNTPQEIVGYFFLGGRVHEHDGRALPCAREEGAGDVDVYRYTPPPGPAELDIEVAPPERVDAKLEVLRLTDGLLLARADAGRRHEAERIANLFSPHPPLEARLEALARLEAQLQGTVR